MYKYNEYELKARVWLYPGMAGWHFITIPEAIAEDIKRQFSDLKKGWGSIPVRVTINNTTWETSIFPDKKTQSYVLPLKAEIRKKENITLEDTITLLLEIKK